MSPLLATPLDLLDLDVARSLSEAASIMRLEQIERVLELLHRAD